METITVPQLTGSCVIMVTMDDEFATWLSGELKARGWSQSELARRAGISHVTVSNLLSGLRGRGEQSCRAIAEALGVSSEMVFRLAGLLPESSQTNDLAYRISLLPTGDQELIDSLIDAMLTKRGLVERKNAPRQASAPGKA
jgi:transcriptional regulator with XRE-family HTH domain